MRIVDAALIGEGVAVKLVINRLFMGCFLFPRESRPTDSFLGHAPVLFVGIRPPTSSATDKNRH